MRESIKASELFKVLTANKDIVIFDIRREEDFKRWKVEGKSKVTYINIPYAEIVPHRFVGAPDREQRETASAKRYFTENTLEDLTFDKEILVVCARGITSDFVAKALRSLGYNAYHLEEGMEGWGNFYYIKEVVEDKDISVYQVIRPARGCLSHIIVSLGEMIIIDPLRHTEIYEKFAAEKKVKISLVLDTHAHADHISGGPKLNKDGIPYYLHPYDGIHPMDMLPAQISYSYLHNRSVFNLGSARITTKHIPGHTLGNVIFILNNKFIFSGDSIFINSISRPDLGGKGEKWAPLHYASLKEITSLGNQMVVLPGHYSKLDEMNDEGIFAAKLGTLKESNEDLMMLEKGRDQFVEYILNSLPEFPTQYVDIKRVNLGILKVDEEKARELELGRNICALARAY